MALLSTNQGRLGVSPVDTVIAFRICPTDAEYQEQELSPELLLDYLINLPAYSLYLNLPVDEVRPQPFSSG